MKPFLRAMAVSALLALLALAAFAGTTYNLTPATSNATIISDLAAGTGGGNIYNFAAGTYPGGTVSWKFPCVGGNVFQGPVVPFVPGTGISPTAILDFTGYVHNNAVALTNGLNSYSTAGQGCTVQYLDFDTQNLYIPGGYSGVLTQFNKFDNIVCSVSGGGNTTSYAAAYFDNAGTINDQNNNSFQWNTMSNNGSDVNSLATDNGSYGTCGGVVIHGSNQNFVFANNNSVGQNTEMFHALGQGTNGTYSSGLQVTNNDCAFNHRICFEFQQGNTQTAPLFQGNDIRDQFNPRQFSFGLSLACCFASGGSNSPGFIANNNLIFNNQALCSGCSYNYGYAIEHWGNLSQSTNNLIQGTFIGNAIAVGGGSSALATGGVVTGNILQGAITAPNCENGGTYPGSCTNVTGAITSTGNTGSGTITAQTSQAPVISPATGVQPAGLIAVTVANTGTNHSNYCTTDGTSPVPNSGTTFVYTVPFNVTSPGTVKCVGMWGRGANPYSYASGYGYVPSGVVTATYTTMPAGEVIVGKGVKAGFGAYFGPPGSAPIPPPSGNVNFSPAAGTITGAKTICLYSGTSCGNNVAGTAIFYTLDGSPANEASQLYTGPISVPDPASTRTVVVNAVLVQMANTTISGCTPTHPCYGVVVQDGYIVKSQLNTNVSCRVSGTLSCPAANFNQSTAAVMPPVQHGACTPTGGTDLGVRGVVDAAWNYINLAQPTVDPFVNTSLMVEMSLATNAGQDCGASTTGTGDTEFLIPAIRTLSVLNTVVTPAPTTNGCDKCTAFATSFYLAHDYEGTTSTTLNPANLSEMELDDNQSNATFNSATGFGYGTFNMRCSMDHAAPITVGGNKYGQWEYSSQSGTNNGWAAFPTRFPSVTAVTHDCTMPFGKLAAINATSCAFSFTPGTTNTRYNGGENSYPLEPGILIIDQGLSSAESVLLTGTPGGSVTGCQRGIGGTTAHTHAANALASLFVKVQAHATQDITTGATCNVGTSNANAMYMDYLSLNGNYYGTADYQSLMGSTLPTPTISVLNTWGNQTVAGNLRSKVCSYFGASDLGDRFWNQKQPYMKPGTGNPAKTGQFDVHDNMTASWGIIGSPAQAIYTQNP